jgi:hypothetical protein
MHMVVWFIVKNNIYEYDEIWNNNDKSTQIRQKSSSAPLPVDDATHDDRSWYSSGVKIHAFVSSPSY